MALCLNVFALPNEHIQFLKYYPQTLEAYLMGQAPDIDAGLASKPSSILAKLVMLMSGKKSPAQPQDWPNKEVSMIGPNVNHRNVDLYHYVLNDTEARVKGAGSLFQTWLDITHHDAIKMDSENESFAFESHRLPVLVSLLSKLDEHSVRARFDAWLAIHNPDYIVQQPEYQEMIQGFERFKGQVIEANKQGFGLMWVTQ
ncbi:hypothetical protein ACVBIL_08935 [Shewanella sp. 125m-7]